MTHDENIAALLKPFSDPEMVSGYADKPRRFVPGYADLHRMTGILLAEQAPADAHVLVLGAGGGLELKALAETHADWRFTGVDPAAEMLKEARRTLGSLAERVCFCEGYIEDAPQGPYDAATCLLTLHFLDAEERLRTLTALRRRLKPGAPFVVAHSSFPQGDARALWLSRYVAFAIASGIEPEKAQSMHTAVDANLCLFSPEEDEAMLRETGFSDVSQFYAAFTWRGWVAYA